MTRLIDADAIPWLIEGVADIPVVTREEIDAMPTIDAVPVRHGRWITMIEFDPKVRANYIRIKCSECNAKIADDWEEKRSIRTILNYRYCPNCGAKMDGERREE